MKCSKNQEQTKHAPLYKFLLAVLLLIVSVLLHEQWNFANKETQLRAMTEKASRSVGMVFVVKNEEILVNGSCFVTKLPPNEINDDIIIVTVAHYLPDSLIKNDSVKIIVGFPGKEPLETVVQIKDEEIDLAVLTPSDTTKYNLPPPLTLGNSHALEVLNEVVLIGTYERIYNVVSKGCVFEPIVLRKRFGKGIPYNHFTFILSNILSGHGYSGCPLFNVNGEVVGIHYGIWNGSSVDIPSNELMYFLSLHSLELRK